ncbi:hypothetical protein SCHPADRAFT_885229 [Schizopora paradoxa]|uniref:Zn(2)-C6 fungal-type domain-containing protein n=1 Tax=Schizopora paradoxa TaxID=27342 RepID=A0A0H2S5Z9_9AGAM|nr:hypothetical protein SCHPADRAFT_885229 [Schizopora paradoxa]
MSSILNKGIQPVSTNDLERSVQLIVHALSDVLSIDSRVIEELRAIAAVQPESSGSPQKRAQNEPKNMDPCEYCRQRKQKCKICPENPNVCVRCLSLGVKVCQPQSTRAIVEDAPSSKSKRHPSEAQSARSQTTLGGNAFES